MIHPSTPSNPSTPPRSTTFPAKSAHKHHIPHHAHRVHHHHADKSVPQSAILPTTTNPFGDFLSRTNTKVDGRADGHEMPPRGLEQQPGNEQVKELKEMDEEGERERETWKEVERLRVARNATDEDLRKRLLSLSTLSTATTRRLDYTYYSLLSSISSLTSVVSSLSSLSAQTSNLQIHFTSSSSSLTSEITTQISSYNKSFDDHACRISQLGKRVKEGREKVRGLGERLDGVREKAERSSLRERESRRIIGKRLKMLWGSLGLVVGLFLILAATRQWRKNEDARRAEVVHLCNQTEEMPVQVVGTRQERGEQGRERQRDDEGWRRSAKTSMRVEDMMARSSAVDADATLRLFDEL